MTNAYKLINLLFVRPVLTIKQVQDFLDVSVSASVVLVNNFLKLKILREITGKKRNRIFVFDEYLKILER